MESLLVFILPRFPLFIGMVLLGGGASVAKSYGLFLPQLFFVENFVGGHEYLHLIIATIISFLAVWATLPDAKKFVFRSVGWPTLMLLVLVIIDELLQCFLPRRHYSLIDLSINVFGIIVGTSSYVLLSLIREKFSDLID